MTALVDLASLQQTLGTTFSDPSLLEQALVHRSHVNENPGLAPVSNERLEFLGDAVLSLVVAERLYRDYPRFDEGEMTKLRSSLVRGDSLARIARTINLGNYLYLGKGEEASGGRDKPSNLAGALEAVIAAVFLDQGMAAAMDFTLRLFCEEMGRVTSRGVKADYKSRLQEIIQLQQQEPPVYRLVESAGPAHDRRFTIEVKAGGSVLGTGSGKSKKTAETEAARLALEKLSAGFTR